MEKGSWVLVATHLRYSIFEAGVNLSKATWKRWKKAESCRWRTTVKRSCQIYHTHEINQSSETWFDRLKQLNQMKNKIYWQAVLPNSIYTSQSLCMNWFSAWWMKTIRFNESSIKITEKKRKNVSFTTLRAYCRVKSSFTRKRQLHKKIATYKCMNVRCIPVLWNTTYNKVMLYMIFQSIASLYWSISIVGNFHSSFSLLFVVRKFRGEQRYTKRFNKKNLWEKIWTKYTIIIKQKLIIVVNANSLYVWHRTIYARCAPLIKWTVTLKINSKTLSQINHFKVVGHKAHWNCCCCCCCANC